MKSYHDLCLERAEKATEGPWSNKGRYTKKWAVISEETDSLGPLTLCDMNSNYPDLATVNSEFIAHARTDVPELCRRLKKAIKKMRAYAICGTNFTEDDWEKVSRDADELEAMPVSESYQRPPDDQL